MLHTEQAGKGPSTETDWCCTLNKLEKDQVQRRIDVAHWTSWKRTKYRDGLMLHTEQAGKWPSTETDWCCTLNKLEKDQVQRRIDVAHWTNWKRTKYRDGLMLHTEQAGKGPSTETDWCCTLNTLEKDQVQRQIDVPHWTSWKRTKYRDRAMFHTGQLPYSAHSCGDSRFSHLFYFWETALPCFHKFCVVSERNTLVVVSLSILKHLSINGMSWIFSLMLNKLTRRENMASWQTSGILAWVVTSFHSKFLVWSFFEG